MLLAFELSGEDETLPKAEVIATLGALDVNYEEVLSESQLLALKTEGDDFDLRQLSLRLAMTHNILEVMNICNASEGSIYNMIDDLKFDFAKDESFMVRVKAKDDGLSSADLEREIGARISSKGYKVDLSSPKRVFRAVVSGGVCVFGTLLYPINRGDFAKRLPHKRPFFYPGVILPRVSRMLVNLSRIRSDETLLDPFCGTGGLLIEGAFIGARTIGGDVQMKMVKGTRENLLYYGRKDAGLIACDASMMPLKNCSVDAVVADPPYGRSAIVKARSIEELYRDSIKEIYRVLKVGGRLVIVSDFPFNDAISGSFELKDRFDYRVHKSMTRYITVLKKGEEGV